MPDLVGRDDAVENLLATIQVLREFWEQRITGDQLDDVDLMGDVFKAAERVAATRTRLYESEKRDV